VGFQPLDPWRVRACRTPEPDKDRVHLPPLVAVEIGDLPIPGVFLGGDQCRWRVDDRQQRAASAAKRIDDRIADRDQTATVASFAEADRQEPRLDQVIDFVQRLRLRRGSEPRQAEQRHVGLRFDAPMQLDQILRADQAGQHLR